jgi:tRNA 2-thiouridine synthesizing protein A
MSENLIVDTKGLLCPLPVIRAQDAAKALAPGDLVTVVATDPGTLHDIPAWTRVHGHTLQSAETLGQEYHFRIRING